MYCRPFLIIYESIFQLGGFMSYNTPKYVLLYYCGFFPKGILFSLLRAKIAIMVAR
jgi:hypothetical protein